MLDTLKPTSQVEHNLRDLRGLLTSDDVNEVVINTNGAVWIERADAAHMIRTEHRFPPGRIKALSDALAGQTNNRIGVKHPLVSGGLTAFGQSLRVQIITPPAVAQGGLNRSSQRSWYGGCNGREKALGSGWTEEADIPRTAASCDP